MLEPLGSGDGAVLRDVADEDDRHAEAARPGDELRRHLAELADAPRRGLELAAVNGLDGVYDEASGRGALHGRQDVLEAGLRQDEQRLDEDAEAFSPQAG